MAACGAALMGMRPVMEIMFMDFLTISMNQLVNQAAKIRFMFGGKASIPMVVRAPAGSGTGAAAQHSQSLEAWFIHTPGLKVVAPATAHDAKGLLITAIREVLKGRIYLTPQITRDVVMTVTEPGLKPAVKLTPRQREVLQLIAEGRRMKEIAAILKLSTRTVETHKYEMMRSLGAESTAELVRYAIQIGLVAR